MNHLKIGMAALVAMIALCVTSVGSTATASAAPGNGNKPQEIVTNTCGDAGGGYTFCLQQDLVQKSISTPSGNQIGSLKGIQSFWLYDDQGDLVFYQTDDADDFGLVKNGVPHVQRNDFAGSYGDGGYVACTVVSSFRYVNGKVLVSTFVNECVYS